ncbi:MAG TPA: hypothetical protein VGU45_06345 [Microvirga sp.]|jgi:hypothetical protein|nr:hypothetical protein [Microvirga sp.]
MNSQADLDHRRRPRAARATARPWTDQDAFDSPELMFWTVMCGAISLVGLAGSFWALAI